MVDPAGSAEDEGGTSAEPQLEPESPGAPAAGAAPDNPSVHIDAKPTRPHAPRIAVRVIDHPTDWVDGDEAQPRAGTGIMGRLPSFDASFFDAPPAEAVTPAASTNSGVRVQTGAEHDSSFGDFVGGGESSDESLPDGITAAVRRTAPLTPDVAASARRAVVMGAEFEPVAVAPTVRARTSRSSRKRTLAVAAPVVFAALLVLSMVLTHGSGRPKLDAGGTSTSEVQAPQTSTTARSTTTAPSSTATTVPRASADADANAPASASTPSHSSSSSRGGSVGPASVGGATPRGGGTTHTTTPSHQTPSPPTTVHHSSPPPPPATTPSVAPPPTQAPIGSCPPAWMDPNCGG